MREPQPKVSVQGILEPESWKYPEQSSSIQCSEQESANYGSLLVFVNDVLLVHGHTHSFIYYLWWLLSYKGRVE